MDKKNSSGKSKKDYESAWRNALAEGKCWVKGCDLTKSTCAHLDHYVSYSIDKTKGFWTEGMGSKRISTMYTDDIDDFSNRVEAKEDVSGAWAFFKKVRKYGLTRDQVGILVRKFGVGMSNRQIMHDMGWVSFDTFFSRYRKALQTLKLRGFTK